MLQGLGAQLNTAVAVHTISQFSAREINEVFGVPLSRITVINPGVNPIFTSNSEVASDALAHYGLDSRMYFLAVSTLEPRKNLRSLILAFSRLRQSQRAKNTLCIVGARGWGALDLPPCTEALEREGTVKFVGYVSNLHLKTLYQNATALLYPSLYEGFGMPIIEALACGTPVISSDTASMPEAAGAVASQVPPLDVEAWSREMQIVADRRDAHEGRQKRIDHAMRFSWDRSAQQTMDLYRACTLSA